MIKKLYISFLLLLCGLDLFALDAEKKLLIDVYFSEASINQKLSSINELTRSGNYEAAKTEISVLKKINPNNLLIAALNCYEANILYNQSDYKKSIELCDNAIQLLNTDYKNGYVIKAMNLKAKSLASIDDLPKAFALLNDTKQRCKEHKNAYGLSVSYYLLGSVLADNGRYPESLVQFDSSLVIKKELEDELGEAACYSFIGLDHSFLGNYSLAISFIQKSITIRERIGDKRGLANSYLNLYKIYYGMGELDKALQSEFKSLEICSEIKDLQCVSGRYTNIGQLYQNKGDYEKAKQYHFKALEISKRINLKNRTALIHENIARVYLKQNQLEIALAHLDTSYSIRTTLNEREGLASTQLAYAIYYQQKGLIDKAIDYAKQSLVGAKQLKLAMLTKDAHELLSDLYLKKNNNSDALYHYKEFIALRDSIYSIEKTKEITRKELEFDFAKKEQVQKIEQEKQLSIADQENQTNRYIRNSSILFLIIVLVFLIIAIRANRTRQKAQQELEFANKLLLSTNNEMKENYKTIELQKHTIEYKNNEITASIKYAYNIQSALMPREDEVANYFNEAFVLFKPKDIISGDFYWIGEVDNKIVYATGDCTGHGVPGGFMSMLGISLLNEVVNEHELTDPAMILSRLRKKVIKALRQKGLSGEHQDGMDMVLCVIDKSKNELVYAAANRPLYIVSKTENGYSLKEYKGDSQPVGIYGRELKPFKQYTVALNEGDVIYTFSDGFADQFGGPDGKKFKYKQMQEMFLAVAGKPLLEQKYIIESTFHAWQGNIEQIDDVCMIGVRV
jgi:serine phosphatase RsbU (regulator of sigma subunit)